jgi:hypothetical protein
VVDCRAAAVRIFVVLEERLTNSGLLFARCDSMGRFATSLGATVIPLMNKWISDREYPNSVPSVAVLFNRSLRFPTLFRVNSIQGFLREAVLSQGNYAELRLLLPSNFM